MSPSPHPLNILITGGGIAGPCLAFWLLKAGHRVTIVERSPSPRKTGQAIDIRGPAVKVLQKMGLADAVQACHTQEQGIQKIGKKGNVIAEFNSTGDPARQTIVSEFEILRADLARIFTEALGEERVKTVYGEYVKTLSQDDKKVYVAFENGHPDGVYDAVIAADGLSSRTRALATGKSVRDDVHFVGGYSGTFTIQRSERDSPTHGQVYNASGGRGILLRPTPDKHVGAYFFVSTWDDPRLAEAATQGVVEQKAILEEYFKDAGWEAERIIEGMKVADDFYFQEVSQVKTDRWAYGRVALLGDCAYAPSPLTGMGTSSAMYGAYILAGELMKRSDNVEEALKNYDKTLRPFIERIQKIIPGAPGIFNPQTELGISVLNGLAMTVSTLRLRKLGEWIGSTKGEEQELPEYDWPEL